MPHHYADIAFPTAVRSLFTYEVPDDLSIKPGMRVWVPLRNEKAIGMVVEVHDRRPGFKTKPVLRVLDGDPVMDYHLLRLTEWIHRFYYCSWGEAIQSALPVGLNFVSEKRLRANRHREKGIDEDERDMLSDIEAGDFSLKEAQNRWREGRAAALLKGLIKKGAVEIWEEPKQNVGFKTAVHLDWADGVGRDVLNDYIRTNASRKWGKALDILSSLDLPAPRRDLLELEGITDYTLKKIESEGLIRSLDLQVSAGSGDREEYAPEMISSLSDEQKEVFTPISDSIHQKNYHSYLLYGVTGSGKTEVYIHALKQVLEQGRGGMVLVPEIALTPQTVRRFYRIFGEKVAVIHSRLNEREKFEAWQGLQSGNKRIVIGPRSAVFAPVKNLGLIVVDEEHDGSYKQFDPSPRYHARDVALMRASMEKAVVIMGSATPSMNSLRAVRNGKHTLLQLPSRPSGDMPAVQILDLKEYKSAMRGPLTVELYEAIEGALKRGEQIILLYNRRGFASYLICEACGHIPQSPDCSVSLTYHKKKNMLLCHYSGYARRVDKHCENCGSDQLITEGSGTQQVEDDVASLFPEAKILRMDRDTTSGKHAHKEIYRQFLDGKADILVGTQIVAKGLDFPNVTVVGVLNAETELAFPSFRAGERMYQLISQVAGRAGRAEKAGHVYVQTWIPDHRAIRFASEHDFWTFAKEELVQRETLLYPPFSRMIVFRFKGASGSRTEKVAHLFCEAAVNVTSEDVVLGPTPSVVEWMHGLYQWEAHIKIKPGYNAAAIETLLDDIFEWYEKVKPKGAASVRITVDVDAIE